MCGVCVLCVLCVWCVWCVVCVCGVCGVCVVCVCACVCVVCVACVCVSVSEIMSIIETKISNRWCRRCLFNHDVTTVSTKTHLVVFMKFRPIQSNSHHDGNDSYCEDKNGVD